MHTFKMYALSQVKFSGEMGGRFTVQMPLENFIPTYYIKMLSSILFLQQPGSREKKTE